MMTRNDYRKIKVALSRPHYLKVMFHSPNNVLNVYWTCQELNEYWGTPYNTCIDFLDNVVINGLILETEDDYEGLPF